MVEGGLPIFGQGGVGGGYYHSLQKKNISVIHPGASSEIGAAGCSSPPPVETPGPKMGQDALEGYLASRVSATVAAEAPEACPAALQRTDSSMLVRCDDGGLRSVPSPRKLHDVAARLLRDFRRQQAASARGWVMCRCLLAGLRERLGGQRQGALIEVLEHHWRGPRAALAWVRWARQHGEEAHQRAQEVLWELSLEGAGDDPWWSRVAP